MERLVYPANFDEHSIASPLNSCHRSQAIVELTKASSLRSARTFGIAK